MDTINTREADKSSRLHSIRTFSNAHFRRAFLRWHYYAAFIVLPVLSLLMLSGLVMLFSQPSTGGKAGLPITAENASPSTAVLLSASSLKAAYPEWALQVYVPGSSRHPADQYILSPEQHHGAGHGHGPSLIIRTNPINGHILQEQWPAPSLYSFAKRFHSSLLLGKVGEWLVEITAGLTVMLVLSGLFLALSQKSTSTRKTWRRGHRLIGISVSVPILFFLFSGLAWTGIWGGKIVQPWAALAIPEEHKNALREMRRHDALSVPEHFPVPWGLLASSLPESQTSSSMVRELNLNRINAWADDAFESPYRIKLPDEHARFWTISSSTIAGDTGKASLNRTVHIDAMSGAILADYRYTDYSTLGKAMALGIPLHEGRLGAWNIAFNTIVILATALVMVAGVAAWRTRKKTHTRGVHAPSSKVGYFFAVCAGMLIAGILFPLSILALLGIPLFDLCVHRYWKPSSCRG